MTKHNQTNNYFWSIPCQNRRPLEGQIWSKNKIEELQKLTFLTWDFSKVNSLPEENSVFILFRTDSDVRGIVGYGQIKNVNRKDKTVELHFFKHLKVIKHRPLYSEIDWFKEHPHVILIDRPVMIDDRSTIEKVKTKTQIFKDMGKTSQISFEKFEIKTEELIETEKKRLGQQQLKKLLVDRFGACEVTGINNQALLIASHIKPWAKFPEDRGCLANCLLLCSALDSLFDKGLISFDDDGKILISSLLNTKVRSQYGLNFKIRLDLESREAIDKILKIKTIRNLRYHRKNIFIK